MKRILNALKWAWRPSSKPGDSPVQATRHGEGSLGAVSELEEFHDGMDPQGLTSTDAEQFLSEEIEPVGLAESPTDEVVSPKPGRIANLKKLVIRGPIWTCKWLLGLSLALINGVISAVLGVVNGVIAAVLWLLNHAMLVVLLIIFGVLIALIQGWL